MGRTLLYESLFSLQNPEGATGRHFCESALGVDNKGVTPEGSSNRRTELTLFPSPGTEGWTSFRPLHHPSWVLTACPEGVGSTRLFVPRRRTPR